MSEPNALPNLADQFASMQRAHGALADRIRELEQQLAEERAKREAAESHATALRKLLDDSAEARIKALETTTRHLGCEEHLETLTRERDEARAERDAAKRDLIVTDEILEGTVGDKNELIGQRDEARAALAEAERKLLDTDMALQSLTPGGSEYVEDPQRCVEFVRSARQAERDTTKNFARRAEEAERKLAERAAAQDRGTSTGDDHDRRPNESGRGDVHGPTGVRPRAAGEVGHLRSDECLPEAVQAMRDRIASLESSLSRLRDGLRDLARGCCILKDGERFCDERGCGHTVARKLLAETDQAVVTRVPSLEWREYSGEPDDLPDESELFLAEIMFVVDDDGVAREQKGFALIRLSGEHGILWFDNFQTVKHGDRNAVDVDSIVRWAPIQWLLAETEVTNG